MSAMDGQHYGLGGTILLSFVLTLFVATQSLAQDQVDLLTLQTYQNHSRLSLNFAQESNPELKTNQTGFEIHFKGLGLSDLGSFSKNIYQIKRFARE